MSHNAKIVIPSGSELVNVIGEMAGVLPLPEEIRRPSTTDARPGLAATGRMAARGVSSSVPRDGNGFPPVL
jgi:hypothetical protein